MAESPKNGILGALDVLYETREVYIVLSFMRKLGMPLTLVRISNGIQRDLLGPTEVANAIAKLKKNRYLVPADHYSYKINDDVLERVDKFINDYKVFRERMVSDTMKC